MADFVNPFVERRFNNPFAGTGKDFINPFEETSLEMPYGWIGRSLDRPISSYDGGAEYLDLVEANRTGRRGILEEAFDVESTQIPFGGALEIPRLFGVAKAAKALAAGEDVSDEQLLNLNTYLEFQKRKSGASWAAKTLDTVQGSIAFGTEIAATTILAGLLAPEPTTTAAGGAIATQTAGKLAASKAARRATEAFVRKALGRNASKVVAKAMEGAVRGNVLHNTLAKAARVNTRKAVAKRLGNKSVGKYLGKIAEVATNLETRALLNQALHPERTVRSVAERRIRNTITGGDESVAASVAKGIADMNFEYASEFSGQYFGALARKLLPEKFVKKLGESILFQTAAGVSDDATMKGAWRTLKAMGVDGALEEMAEERAGDFMRGLFGVQGEAGLLNAIKQSWPDAEQFSIEAAAFTVMPIMASGMNRAAGGLTSPEIAEAVALARGMGSKKDVHAMTEAQNMQDAQKIVDALQRERQPWYIDSGFDWLGKIFGKTRRGALDSIARRNGINLIRIHDVAVENERKAAKKENRAPDPTAGTQAIFDVLEHTRKIQATGIETEADRELFEAGVKDGSIVQAQEKALFRYFAAPQALSKSEYKELAKKTGIAHVVDIGKADLADLEIGTVDAAVISAKDWQSLPAEKKKELSERWNSKNERYLSSKYNLYRKIITAAGSQDFTLHEVLPSVIRGTAEELGDKGYHVQGVAPVFDQDENGKDRHIMYLGAMNTEDGKDVYVSTHASEWSIAEDIIEAKLKQGIAGIEISPEAQKWMDGIRSELESKKERTKAEQQAYDMLGDEDNRFEFFVKSFLLNRMGYEAQADKYTRNLLREMPADFDADVIAAVGQDLIDALAVTPLTVERGERHEAVRQLTGERSVGNVAEARRIVASAEGDALINQLSDALGQDMRKRENRQAVQDILTEMDRTGVTFSLESAYGMENEFADLKQAVEKGTDQAINRAIKHFLLRLPSEEQRTEREPDDDEQLRTSSGEVLEERVEGERRQRADRAAKYPTPEFAKRVIPFKREGEYPTRRYNRSGARTVIQPAKRTKAGQELSAARTSSSKPFEPEAARLDIDPAQIEADMDQAEEKRFVAEQFGEDGPVAEQVKLPAAEVARDETGAARTPRNYATMKALDSGRDIASQLTLIVPTGSGSMLRIVRDLTENYARQADIHDAVYIPSEKFYGDRTKWLRRIRKATWENQDGTTTVGPLQWDPRSVPHLSIAREALRNENLDIEGAIFVLDYSSDSMENYLGLPMQRAMHLAITGQYPMGHAYPQWSWVESEGVRKGVLQMDVDEILGEIDENPGKIYDFAEGTKPQVWRSAVFPISTRRLQRIADNLERGKTQEVFRKMGNEQLDNLANEVHDWMRRNKIRRLMVGGIDQVKTGKPYRTRDGKLEFESEEVINPRWASAFSRMLKKAISIETTKRRAREETAQPIQVTAEEAAELERAMSEGTFSLEDMGVGSVPLGIDVSPAEQIATEIGVRFEGVQETIPGQDDLWFFTDIEHSGSTFATLVGASQEQVLARRNKVRESFGDETFSLTPDYIFKRVLAFNNNRMTPSDRRNAKNLIRRLYQGDPKALRTMLRKDSSYLSPADKEKMGAVLTAINERVAKPEPEPSTAGVPVAPEYYDYEREMDTASLEMMESIFDVQSPVFMSGDVALHRALIEADRERRARVQVAQAKVDNWRESVGLFEKAKNLPEGHAERATRLLEAVGAILDNSQRIPRNVREYDWKKYGDTWTRKIDVEWDPASVEQMAQEWDRYIADNNLDMPTAAELTTDMRAEYDASREAVNESLSQLTDEEWIKYLEDYINHNYVVADPRTVRKIKEDARQSKERRIDTYEEAAEKHGLLPVTMDATKLYQIWNRSVWAAQRNKSLLSLASVLRDADGSPMVIPIRTGELQKGVSSVIDDKVLRQAGRQLAEYLEKDYSEAEDPAGEVRRLAATMDLGQHGYVRMDSPYTQSISYFLVKDGPAHNIMKMALNYGRWDNAAMRSLERFNAWSKFSMLALSAFHPFALLESLVSVFGIQWDNPVRRQLHTKEQLTALAKTMRTNPEIWEEAVRAGLMVDVGNPDIRLGIVEQDIRRSLERLEKIAQGSNVGKKYLAKVARPGVRAVQTYKHFIDKWLWHTFHPAIKMHSYQFVYQQWQNDNPNAGEDENRQAREDTARYINQAFGGQDFNEYLWATPFARQMLHAVIFAPDWTISAANVSGATRLPGFGGKFHASNLSPLARDNMLRRYWPAMIAIVLIGLPNLVQSLVYAAFGDPDEGDKPFTFQNEAGKRTYIDWTPLFRKLPGYTGGDSGKRRYYMRWGKQAYEVFDGWFKNPLDMAMRKSSSAFRTAFEWATGSTTSGWDLPFKGEGLAGLVSSPEGFMGSRVGTTAQKFIPISVSAIAQGKPTAFVAPVSRGVTIGTVTYSMRKTLESYVDSTTLPKHLREFDPKQLISELVNAAEVNGIDPVEAFKRAKNQVLGKYYLNFFRALNEGKDAELQAVAEKLAILGKGVEDLHRNVDRRLTTYGRDYDPTLRERVAEAARSIE